MLANEVQLAELRKLQKEHDVEGYIVTRLAPIRIIAYVREPGYDCPAEVHIHPDGRVLWSD